MSFNNFIFATLLVFSTMSSARMPVIIAHRGGTGDAPENTEYAIQKALKNKADAVWVTLQLSKDNVIVLYRPLDLSMLTNLTGAVSAYTAVEMKKADAAYKYQPPAYPLRNRNIAIPTLDDVLKKWPDTFFFLDIKSPDASPQKFSEVLLTTLKKNRSLNRVRVYSTDGAYLAALPESIPKFESRDLTRNALVDVTINQTCDFESEETAGKWFGYEMKREVQIIEKYTLGEGITKYSLRWNDKAVRCFKKNPKNKVILFGINTPEDYLQAKNLGADGVLVDSPKMFMGIK